MIGSRYYRNGYDTRRGFAAFISHFSHLLHLTANFNYSSCTTSLFQEENLNENLNSLIITTRSISLSALHYIMDTCRALHTLTIRSQELNALINIEEDEDLAHEIVLQFCRFGSANIPNLYINVNFEGTIYQAAQGAVVNDRQVVNCSVYLDNANRRRMGD